MACQDTVLESCRLLDFDPPRFSDHFDRRALEGTTAASRAVRLAYDERDLDPRDLCESRQNNGANLRGSEEGNAEHAVLGEADGVFVEQGVALSLGTWIDVRTWTASRRYLDGAFARFFVHLLSELLLGHFLFEAGEPVHEENAFEVVDFVLQANGQ